MSKKRPTTFRHWFDAVAPSTWGVTEVPQGWVIIRPYSQGRRDHASAHLLHAYRAKAFRGGRAWESLFWEKP